MKKFLIFPMMLVVVVLLSGCFGRGGNNFSVVDEAVGTWRLVRVEERLGAFTYTLEPGHDKWGLVAGYLVLNADGSFVDIWGALGVLSGTWGISGNTIRFEGIFEGLNFRDDWSMELDGDSFRKSMVYQGITETWIYERVTEDIQL